RDDACSANSLKSNGSPCPKSFVIGLYLAEKEKPSSKNYRRGLLPIRVGVRGAARKAKRKRSLFPSLRPLLYPLPNGGVTTNFAICNSGIVSEPRAVATG